MKVSDILRVKGGTLFTVSPDQSLSAALDVMSQHDIGSLVVMDHGELVGMLTFREVIQAVVKNGGTLGNTRVQSVMDDHPLTCTPETELDEVRRMMLGRHARYMPVLSERTLMGVISFYDVAKAVVDSQDFENRMLKAYIRDWPVESRDELPVARIATPLRTPRAPSTAGACAGKHPRHAVSRHQFRREPRPGDRLRRRRLPARDGALARPTSSPSSTGAVPAPRATSPSARSRTRSRSSRACSKAGPPARRSAC